MRERGEARGEGKRKSMEKARQRRKPAIKRKYGRETTKAQEWLGEIIERKIKRGCGRWINEKKRGEDFKWV